MYANERKDTTYAQVQALGGNIDGEEIIVEYEKTTGGTKTIGGEVVNAYENYDNRNNVRKVVIDLESHAGNWRLVAENGRVEEVTLYAVDYERDGIEKTGEIQKTRISTRDGVTDVVNADDW